MPEDAEDGGEEDGAHQQPDEEAEVVLRTDHRLAQVLPQPPQVRATRPAAPFHRAFRVRDRVRVGVRLRLRLRLRARVRVRVRVTGESATALP